MEARRVNMRFCTPMPAHNRLRRLNKSMGEAQFLSGRHSWPKEVARLIRIGVEFFRGFSRLRNIGPAVTVFGSARFKEGHPYYELARQAGRALASHGFTVMTGGGPGVMEAASRGAKEAGGRTVGCHIIVPHEQRPNPFLDRVVTFYFFFARKVMLVKYSCAFVIFPGGMGTLDEMTEAITLIQTGKLYDFPVILMASDYWKGFHEWIEGTLIRHGAVRPEELSFVKTTDSAEEMSRIILDAIRGTDLRLVPLKPLTD